MRKLRLRGVNDLLKDTRLSNDRKNSDADLYDSAITLPFKSGLNMNAGRKEEVNERGK